MPKFPSEQDPHLSKTASRAVGRRDLIRLVGTGGLGLAAVKVLPGKWTKPVVDGLVLPAHAQASPGAGALYGSNRDGALFLLNTVTGVGTLVGNMPFDATEIEYDGLSMRAWAQQRNGAFTITEFDISTAAGIGGPVNDNASFTGLEFVGGVLYGVWIAEGGGASTFGTLDPTTGISSAIGLTGVGPISGLAYNGTMYGIAGGGSPADLYTINMGTGVATVVGSAGIGAGSLQFGPDANLYAGGDNDDGGNLYRINTGTGAATLVGATGFGSVTGLTLT